MKQRAQTQSYEAVDGGNPHIAVFHLVTPYLGRERSRKYATTRRTTETCGRLVGGSERGKTTERRNQLVAATYQNRVEIVGISLWIRSVDGQRHTVGEYRREN